MLRLLRFHEAFRNGPVLRPLCLPVAVRGPRHCAHCQAALRRDWLPEPIRRRHLGWRCTGVLARTACFIRCVGRCRPGQPGMPPPRWSARLQPQRLLVRALLPCRPPSLQPAFAAAEVRALAAATRAAAAAAAWALHFAPAVCGRRSLTRGPARALPLPADLCVTMSGPDRVNLKIKLKVTRRTGLLNLPKGPLDAIAALLSPRYRCEAPRIAAQLDSRTPLLPKKQAPEGATLGHPQVGPCPLLSGFAPGGAHMVRRHRDRFPLAPDGGRGWALGEEGLESRRPHDLAEHAHRWAVGRVQCVHKEWPARCLCVPVSSPCPDSSPTVPQRCPTPARPR